MSTVMIFEHCKNLFAVDLWAEGVPSCFVFVFCLANCFFINSIRIRFPWFNKSNCDFPFFFAFKTADSSTICFSIGVIRGVAISALEPTGGSFEANEEEDTIIEDGVDW